MLSVALALVELLLLLAGVLLFAAQEWRWRRRLVSGRRARWLSVLLWLPAPARFLLAEWVLGRAQSRELAIAAIRQIELALVLSVCLLAAGLVLSAPSEDTPPEQRN